MKTCPACGQRVLVRHNVWLSPLLADIFDAIERTGIDGIPPRELAVMFYGEDTKSARRVVAVNVNHLNKKLAGAALHIGSAAYGVYRVVPVQR